jgi:hypothetical protein
VQQEREFIAADAREHIVAADVERHTVRELAQEPVAGPMPERIVDRLEVIEIDVRDRVRRAAMARGLERNPDDLLEVPAVRQARERIVTRFVGETPREPRLRRDIA